MRSIEAMYEAQEDARGDVMRLAQSLQTPLFATRENISEAYEDLFALIRQLPKKEQGSVIAGVQILVNTIAEEVKRQAEWR